MPEASVRNDLLTVSFDGAGTYSLYVKDSFGVTVYSSALPANGMEYDYDSYFTKMKELVPSKTQELNILYHSNKVRRFCIIQTRYGGPTREILQAGFLRCLRRANEQDGRQLQTSRVPCLSAGCRS